MTGRLQRTEMNPGIERDGDETNNRPACRTLTGVMARFAKFSPDFLVEGRGEHEQAERDSL